MAGWPPTATAMGRYLRGQQHGDEGQAWQGGSAHGTGLWPAPTTYGRRSCTTGHCSPSCWTSKVTIARRPTDEPRREDLSTADLAGQQPTDTTLPERAAVADVQRHDPTDDELRREDLAATEERGGGTTVAEDRHPDRGTGDHTGRRSCRSGGSRQSDRRHCIHDRPTPGHRGRRGLPGPAGPTSRPGSSTRHAGPSSRPTRWSPSSCSTWPAPSPTSGAGWSAIGTKATTSPLTTSATPSSATVRSSNGFWPPDGLQSGCNAVRPAAFLTENVGAAGSCRIAVGSGCPHEQARPMMMHAGRGTPPRHRDAPAPPALESGTWP
jgi:hypothetical protein